MTLEREPTGEPLAAKVSTDDPEPLPEAVDCLVAVLRALAAARARIRGHSAVPDLDEGRPLWQGHASFASALADLLDRGGVRCGELLTAHVDDFGGKHARLAGGLRSVAQAPQAVVHGDLFPENVLVDDDLRTCALVDYGFMSTAGDPVRRRRGRLLAGVVAAVVCAWSLGGPAEGGFLAGADGRDGVRPSRAPPAPGWLKGGPIPPSRLGRGRDALGASFGTSHEVGRM